MNTCDEKYLLLKKAGFVLPLRNTQCASLISRLLDGYGSEWDRDPALKHIGCLLCYANRQNFEPRDALVLNLVFENFKSKYEQNK